MCAAPGSKTAQLIEQLHSTCKNTVPSKYAAAEQNANLLHIFPIVAHV